MGQWGKYNWYPGSGFVMKLNAANHVEKLALLRQTRWLDTKTRAVIVDFVVYSPNADLSVVIHVIFEILPGGVVDSVIHVEAIALDRYPLASQHDFVLAALEVFVYMMVVGYAWEEVKGTARQGFGKRYGRLGWTWLDVTNILVFAFSAFQKFLNLTAYWKLLAAGPEEAEETPQRIMDLGLAMQLADQVNGFNGFLLWIKLYKYVVVSRRIQRIVVTVG
ncbi:Polycystin cation channel, partial [Baffinella frigidus]